MANADANLLDLAADIVSAFVSNNNVPTSELPALIQSVHTSLRNVGNPDQAQEAEKPVPRIPIKKTITPDAIISLEDGKPYRSMKRHLRGRGLTPTEYRTKWGLP